jgi:hypothetical protein
VAGEKRGRRRRTGRKASCAAGEDGAAATSGRRSFAASGCGIQKGPESHIPWHGDRFPIGICMALLWADCNGSGRLMKSSNVYEAQNVHVCDMMYVYCDDFILKSDGTYRKLLALIYQLSFISQDKYA